MSSKELTAFRIEADIMAGLRRVKDRDGVPLSIQVDGALRVWLADRGVALNPPVKASRPTPKPTPRRRRA